MQRLYNGYTATHLSSFQVESRCFGYSQRFAAMFQGLAITDAVCFSVRPLADRNLVGQLAVRGTCVFPLVWRVSDHNTASLSISRNQTLQRTV